jgi:putative endopeptidase
MRHVVSLVHLLVLVVPVLVGSAGAQPAVSPVPATGTTAAEGPLTTFPYTPGLDPLAMDHAADPCVDFYRYACGGWMTQNPIPADQSAWNVYAKLAEDNRRYLWGVLDDLARRTAGRSAPQQKIGDYFAACMDEAAIARRGATPLAPVMARIAALHSLRDLPRLLAELTVGDTDDGVLFGFGANQDFEDSRQVIAFADAGGLGLPDRDYYLNDDERSRGLRAKYLAHVARMLALAGDAPADAERDAATIMAFETALATASLSKVDRRDPYKIAHRMDRREVQALTPAFDWTAYLTTLRLTGVRTFNVTEPAFFRAVDRELTTRSLDELRAYLRWHVLRSNARYLSPPFVDENFDFYSRTLRGVPELRPRWKRCVALVDGQLGEALGREYVRRSFPPALKMQAVHMTQQIEKAMADDIRQLDWMSPATKRNALAKLHAVTNKIGYPERWRDYGPVRIARDDFYGNVVRARAFEARRQLAKIGKPVDRLEWGMTPPTVNAYYDPQLNDINFPAGVLQPPLYDPKMDAAPNYGNTGGTIGHELTHGFDDSGRQFDAAGNLRDWWTPADAAGFEARAQCVVDQFAQYTVVDDVRINSKLTLGEDVADLGGTILAWMAWKAETAGADLPSIGGLSPAQRFFVGFAQWACENQRPENARLLAITDSHSPSRWRVNGVVANMPEFERAFACRSGQPMAPLNRCRVW